MKIAYIRPDIRFNLPEQYVQFNEACPNCDPEDGLIREVDQEGTVRYHNSNNLLNREDGPAIEYSNGDRVWFLGGKLHREDGPAVELVSGSREWYLGGKLHREDGPAVERPDGIRFWYLDGKRLSEDEFEALQQPQDRRHTKRDDQ